MRTRVGYLAASAILGLLLPPVAHAGGTFDFSAYPAGNVYQGKPRLPDFKGRDKDFALFKTRIVDAMKAGVTFAGQYSTVRF